MNTPNNSNNTPTTLDRKTSRFGTTLGTKVAAATLGGALLFGAFAPAVSAQEAPPEEAESQEHSQQDRVERLRQWALDAIDKRVVTLEDLGDRVEAADHMTEAHKSDLLGQYRDDIRGLTVLRTQVLVEEDPETLKAQAQSVILDYRVYLVTVPKTRIAAAADTIVAAVDKMSDGAEQIDDAIERAREAGHDVRDAEAALHQMKSSLASAAVNVHGVADTMISLQPQGYPGNEGILDEGRRSVTEGKDQAKQAHAAAVAAVQALRDAVGG